jgi:hypothetical protein
VLIGLNQKEKFEGFFYFFFIAIRISGIASVWVKELDNFQVPL